MLWRCPACQTPIKHEPEQAHPVPHVVYRCHVCRLELAFDERSNRLALAPLEPSDPPPPKKRFPI